VKEDLLREAADKNYLLIFEHSPRMKVGRVLAEGNSFTFAPETYD
jgi:hypothetical protein